jgi:hypothetical protein
MKLARGGQGNTGHAVHPPQLVHRPPRGVQPGRGRRRRLAWPACTIGSSVHEPASRQAMGAGMVSMTSRPPGQASQVLARVLGQASIAAATRAALPSLLACSRHLPSLLPPLRVQRLLPLLPLLP